MLLKKFKASIPFWPLIVFVRNFGHFNLEFVCNLYIVICIFFMVSHHNGMLSSVDNEKSQKSLRGSKGQFLQKEPLGRRRLFIFIAGPEGLMRRLYVRTFKGNV